MVEKFEVNGLFGLRDYETKAVLVEPIYEEIGGFVPPKNKKEEANKEEANRERIFINGLARVKKNGKYGYLNTDLKLTVPCDYKDLPKYTQGEAHIVANIGNAGGEDYFILINKEGARIGNYGNSNSMNFITSSSSTTIVGPRTVTVINENGEVIQEYDRSQFNWYDYSKQNQLKIVIARDLMNPLEIADLGTPEEYKELMINLRNRARDDIKRAEARNASQEEFDKIVANVKAELEKVIKISALSEKVKEEEANKAKIEEMADNANKQLDELFNGLYLGDENHV